MPAKKRTGLGRGIGALIPQSGSGDPRPSDVFFQGQELQEADAAPVKKKGKVAGGAKAEAASEAAPLQRVPGAEFTELELSDIVPNRAQPRTNFDEEALAELTHSIREFGVFQPIVVREIIPRPKSAPHYELIMGERRFRASQRAGLTRIPAVIRQTDDENMLRDALLENLHRAELNPLEEASAYQQLMSDFGITQEQLAERIGRSRPRISNTIRLLKLPESVQVRVAAGVLSAGHARAILSLDGDLENMQRLADKIVNEQLSVREAENAATRLQKVRAPKARAGKAPAQLQEFEDRLADRLSTRVTIKLGAKRGQVVIDFATISDLMRIMDEIDPAEDRLL